MASVAETFNATCVACRPDRFWSERYQEEVFQLLPRFKPQELANVLWAMAVLKMKLPEVGGVRGRGPGFEGGRQRFACADDVIGSLTMVCVWWGSCHNSQAATFLQLARMWTHHKGVSTCGSTSFAAGVWPLTPSNSQFPSHLHPVSILINAVRVLCHAVRVCVPQELLSQVKQHMSAFLPAYKVHEVAVSLWALARLKSQPGLRLMAAALQHCFSQVRAVMHVASGQTASWWCGVCSLWAVGYTCCTCNHGHERVLLPWELSV